MAPLKILVLTLNTAALPFVHPAVAERVAAQAEAIRAGGYDVAGLQEVWLKRDERTFREKAGLPYAYSGRPGFPAGSGVLILSRWPMESTEERAFDVLRPSWLKITNGEPAARKGVLRAVVRTPGGPLDVYATHLLSNYGPGTKYTGLRTAELFELAEFILERSKGRPYVLLGDLNTGWGSPDYDLFMGLLGAVDACRESGKEACGDRRRGGERIDHILLPSRAPKPPARGVFDGDLPGRTPPVFWSDHSGFSADLSAAHLRPAPPPDPKRRAAALEAFAARMTRMIALLDEEGKRASWIPVYGALAKKRYARQAAVFAALRERALSAIPR